MFMLCLYIIICIRFELLPNGSHIVRTSDHRNKLLSLADVIQLDDAPVSDRWLRCNSIPLRIMKLFIRLVYFP